MGLDGSIDDPFDFRTKPAMTFIWTAQMRYETRCLADAVYRTTSRRTVRGDTPRVFAAASIRASDGEALCGDHRASAYRGGSIESLLE
jgi:hypothetical protein